MKKADGALSFLRSLSTVIVPSQPVASRVPLGALPNGTLFRSLLIAGISSKKFLLLPSLKVLSFLAKPGRSLPFNAERNPLLHTLLKKTVYNQFCAGENGKETKYCVQWLKDLGFKGVILTYARETVFDHKSNTFDVQEVESSKDAGLTDSTYCPHIEEWRAGTKETVGLLSDGDILAIKMSGAGPSVTKAFASGRPPPQQFIDALNEIFHECKANSIQVIVDAESQHFQKGIAATTLDLMRKFNRDGTAVVYSTYQAYLKRTPDVIAEHLDAASKEGFTLGLKLVRGAYILSDDRSLIHDRKQETDDAYDGIATGALKKQIGEFGAAGGRPFPSVNLFLASHNKTSVFNAHKLHQERIKNGLPTVPLGFGQLHGMSDNLSFSLLAAKDENQVSPDVFKCSTWGTMSECLGYLLRRAVENRDAVLRTADDEGSKARLTKRFSNSERLTIRQGASLQGVKDADVVILGVDPSDVDETLKQPGLADALAGKLLISIAAGWTRQQIEDAVTKASSDGNTKPWVVRTLPNIAATVSQSITAIEKPDPKLPSQHLETTDAIFSKIGKTVHLAPSQMDAFTAVGGSTPAFFAVIVDALIDSAVAVGLPRQDATAIIVQSMLGTATLLQSGIHPGILRDQGTSPEGCTIGGLMVLEETGVRGGLSRGLREAVTIARLMGKDPHVNDTRH
ncbi:FAD-linked oxidoreductase [Paramyrothecium foliicola]|nr:FAD-linked oxidoreductase [Paramyrothecium foliicola]